MQTCRLLAWGTLLLGVAAGCASRKTDSGDAKMGEVPVPHPDRLDPPAPAKYRVKFETSKGDFVVEVTSELAPIGSNRFHSAVAAGFYDGCRFFRVVPGFVVQFGINGDPKEQKKWRTSPIMDDPVNSSNTKGTLTFAKGGPNSRTTQVFINLANNSRLDADGFPAFGKVISGMEVVESINSEYGERPDQGKIQSQGNEYLNGVYPRLDYIKQATILKDDGKAKTETKKKQKNSTAPQTKTM